MNPLEMEYCVFVEHNQKERESFVFYLQYTGNEKELNLLYRLVSKADNGNLVGDVAYFEMADPAIRISQAAVDEHKRIILGTYSQTIQVVNGKLRFGFREDEISDLDGYDIARVLDRMFFHCQIKEYFKSPENKPTN